jgi:hypothetical protein
MPSAERGSSVRRPSTACVRRSSSGASSRNPYGRTERTERAKGEGSGRSTATRSIEPSASPRRIAASPSTSIASRRQSSTVCRTIGWSGISRSPGGSVSPHAAAAGKHAARRSSARIRWICGAMGRPSFTFSSSSEREEFQRQRAENIGVTRAAWTRRASTVSARR